MRKTCCGLKVFSFEAVSLEAVLEKIGMDEEDMEVFIEHEVGRYYS